MCSGVTTLRGFEDLALHGRSSSHWQRRHIEVYALDQVANVVVNERAARLTQAHTRDQHRLLPDDAFLVLGAPFLIGSGARIGAGAGARPEGGASLIRRRWHARSN